MGQNIRGFRSWTLHTANIIMKRPWGKGSQGPWLPLAAVQVATTKILTTNWRIACADHEYLTPKNYPLIHGIHTSGYSGKSSVVNCSGSSSCVQATLSNAQHLECRGSSSCNGASLNNAQQLECSGSSSCRSASLNNAQQLECTGSSSCSYASLLNAEESINCSGPLSCQYVNNITTGQLHCSRTTTTTTILLVITAECWVLLQYTAVDHHHAEA